MPEILVYDPDRKTNAQAIEDCVALGHLRKEWTTWDCTYGLGKFWDLWKPDILYGTDLHPDKGADTIDYAAAPFADESWDVVVFDPPYKLNGTPDMPDLDSRFGTNRRVLWKDRIRDINSGLVEACRIARERVLFKCQDQVHASQKVWQTIDFARTAEGLGWRLVDQLYVASYRPQPPNRRQEHARQNFSSLMIFTKENVRDWRT